MSKWSLRNYAKRFGMIWNRFRQSLKQKRDKKAFRLAQQKFAGLVADPELNVVHIDEVCFSMKAVVPYGWQPTGQRFGIELVFHWHIRSVRFIQGQNAFLCPLLAVRGGVPTGCATLFSHLRTRQLAIPRLQSRSSR